MTGEELDQARADEAMRLWSEGGYKRHPLLIVAQLAREGWTPPPQPVDPDVLVVREVLAAGAAAQFGARVIEEYREGQWDKSDSFQASLAAYRAEIQRESTEGGDA